MAVCLFPVVATKSAPAPCAQHRLCMAGAPDGSKKGTSGALLASMLGPDANMSENRETRPESNAKRAKQEHSQDASQGGRGRGKGTGKGKGKGKGKARDRDSAEEQHQDRSSAASGGVRELVELERRACIRLLQTHRESQQESNFILEIPASMQVLRRELQQVSENWKIQRPPTGSHPLGKLHDLHWFLICSRWQEHMESEVETSMRQQSEALATTTQFLRSTFIANSANEHDSVLLHCHPLGRRDRPPLENTWFWSLAFTQHSSQGRDVHETLCEQLRLDKLYLFVQLRKDRGTMDGLERQLRSFEITS